eukprot:TRINITY_DN659_c0_g1_i2.p1 TRINITY_DN659_c0_g1~~TRINITY_DN659_c0_g1_i2.p1  ORF type:complete len:411 (-),score=32.65 TRINITY_DN659_c0_g1_i2:159-1391(-)
MGLVGACCCCGCWLSFVWLFLSLGSAAALFNITTLLENHPEFQRCNDLLTTTNVAKEINNRTSLTILVPPNSILENFLASYGAHLPLVEIQYVMQYHVLLEYMDWGRLRQASDSGMLVTTLYQTTGKASKNFGYVNITSDKKKGQISIRALDPYGPRATVTKLVKALPYTISVFSIDSLLLPYGFGFSSSSESNTVAVNVTAELIDAKNFNFFASMIVASGFTSELDSDQAGAGITLFAPTDDAFSALPPDTLQSLTAENKGVVLRFHVLHSYYPLGSLESIVNPVQPTLATESIGAGRYTLNITRANGSVIVDTGVVQASITQTVYDQKPLAIFGVSKVLLPQELFGKHEQNPPTQTPIRSPSPQGIPGIPFNSNWFLAIAMYYYRYSNVVYFCRRFLEFLPTPTCSWQ